MPVRPLIRFPGPEPRTGNVTLEILAIYAVRAVCDLRLLVAFIERFSRLGSIRSRTVSKSPRSHRRTLANLDDARLGTAIKNFLGDLDDPDWEDHWTSLDAAPA